eukprot:m.611052 g.611052  ORF g.611052 m.611052 type:complete len:138 (+) comp58136_c0_seq9:1249-1662(+)
MVPRLISSANSPICACSTTIAFKESTLSGYHECARSILLTLCLSLFPFLASHYFLSFPFLCFVCAPLLQAFHFGQRFLVEIDIVLPPDMRLQDAHDIGQSLQLKVEQLEDVERAFVHLDFEASHDPRSEHKQWGIDQ